MNETLNKLRPIEKFYLISLEKKGIFNKKEALHCIIYSLLENKNIILKKDKVKLNITGTNPNRGYEDTFIRLIKEKKYIELNTFVVGLNNFNQSLIDHSILTNTLGIKKVFFIKLAKQEIGKTALYYDLQSHFKKQFDESINIMDIVCKNHTSKDNILKVYSLLKDKIIKAHEEQEKKKKEKKIGDINFFNKKE